MILRFCVRVLDTDLSPFALHRVALHVLSAFIMQQSAMCGFNNRVEISTFQGHGQPPEINDLAFLYLVAPRCKPFLALSTPLAKHVSKLRVSHV